MKSNDARRAGSCAQRGLLALLGILALTAIGARAQVASTFDADLEGWRVTGDNSAAWEADTGNPGGCLAVNDRATGAMNYVIAPPTYHGDWTGMTAADSLSVDIYLKNLGGGVVNPEYIFRIAGPGGAARALSGAAYYPADGVWTHYTVPLDESQWVVEQGTWDAILANVNTLRITGEFVNGREACRVDNVVLSGSPAAVWEPCLWDTFTTGGTGDWSYQNTGGVTNPGSGGNGGGYLRIADAAGLSVMLAPATFLGDWSPMDGLGYVSLDVRILSGSGERLGVVEFIRLSGPGGSAYVTLDTADLPPIGNAWQHIRYPLDPTVWTVDAGQWSALLADVAECRIYMEFFSGSETIGLDNFGRGMADCAPPDDTVIVHDPEMHVTDRYGVADIYATAYNRREGWLYGVVRTATNGLYAVTGPQRGVRLQTYDRPAHLIFDDGGNAYISEDYSGNIYRRSPDGASVLWVSGFAAGDDDPFGMTIAPPGFVGTNVNPGDILVADRGYSGPDLIWAFSPMAPENERQMIPDPGNVDYFDLAADAFDKVYISDDLDANRLRVLTADGSLGDLALDPAVPQIASVVYDATLDALYIASRSGRAVYRVSPATGDVVLVADGFGTLEPGCLEVDAPTRRLWVTDVGRGRVYELRLPGGVGVDVSVALEGSQRPDPEGWRIPLRIRCFEPGADVMSEAPAAFYHLRADKHGDRVVCTLPALAPGVYDVAASADHTLMNVKRDVVIAAPAASVDMGTLAEGDADADGAIDLEDVARLSAAWAAAHASGTYDAAADFDRNLQIDLEDLLLLTGHWLEQSPVELE